jgi:choline transport protein
LYGHLGGFLVVMIPLWVMCPKNSASDVFTSVVNSGGWSSKGTSYTSPAFLI